MRSAIVFDARRKPGGDIGQSVVELERVRHRAEAPGPTWARVAAGTPDAV